MVNYLDNLSRDETGAPRIWKFNKSGVQIAKGIDKSISNVSGKGRGNPRKYLLSEQAKRKLKTLAKGVDKTETITSDIEKEPLKTGFHTTENNVAASSSKLETALDETTKIIKKKGRPRKNPIEASIPDIASVSGNEQNDLQPETTTASTVKSWSSLQKSVFKSKKRCGNAANTRQVNVVQNSVEVTVIPKKKGRPRKNSIVSSTASEIDSTSADSQGNLQSETATTSPIKSWSSLQKSVFYNKNKIVIKSPQSQDYDTADSEAETIIADGNQAPELNQRVRKRKRLLKESVRLGPKKVLRNKEKAPVQMRKDGKPKLKPGRKPKKRTLSGEYNLLEENVLRKKLKNERNIKELPKVQNVDNAVAALKDEISDTATEQDNQQTSQTNAAEYSTEEHMDSTRSETPKLIAIKKKGRPFKDPSLNIIFVSPDSSAVTKQLKTSKQKKKSENKSLLKDSEKRQVAKRTKIKKYSGLQIIGPGGVIYRKAKVENNSELSSLPVSTLKQPLMKCLDTGKIQIEVSKTENISLEKSQDRTTLVEMETVSNSQVNVSTKDEMVVTKQDLKEPIKGRPANEQLLSAIKNKIDSRAKIEIHANNVSSEPKEDSSKGGEINYSPDIFEDGTKTDLNRQTEVFESNDTKLNEESRASIQANESTSSSKASLTTKSTDNALPNIISSIPDIVPKDTSSDNKKELKLTIQSNEKTECDMETDLHAMPSMMKDSQIRTFTPPVVSVVSEETVSDSTVNQNVTIMQEHELLSQEKITATNLNGSSSPSEKEVCSNSSTAVDTTESASKLSHQTSFESDISPPNIEDTTLDNYDHCLSEYGDSPFLVLEEDSFDSHKSPNTPIDKDNYEDSLPPIAIQNTNEDAHLISKTQLNNEEHVTSMNNLDNDNVITDFTGKNDVLPSNENTHHVIEDGIVKKDELSSNDNADNVIENEIDKNNELSSKDPFLVLEEDSFDSHKSPNTPIDKDNYEDSLPPIAIQNTNEDAHLISKTQLNNEEHVTSMNNLDNDNVITDFTGKNDVLPSNENTHHVIEDGIVKKDELSSNDNADNVIENEIDKNNELSSIENADNVIKYDTVKNVVLSSDNNADNVVENQIEKNNELSSVENADNGIKDPDIKNDVLSSDDNVMKDDTAMNNLLLSNEVADNVMKNDTAKNDESTNNVLNDETVRNIVPSSAENTDSVIKEMTVDETVVVSETNNDIVKNDVLPSDENTYNVMKNDTVKKDILSSDENTDNLMKDETINEDIITKTNMDAEKQIPESVLDTVKPELSSDTKSLNSTTFDSSISPSNNKTDLKDEDSVKQIISECIPENIEHQTLEKEFNETRIKLDTNIEEKETITSNQTCTETVETPLSSEIEQQYTERHDGVNNSTVIAPIIKDNSKVEESSDGIFNQEYSSIPTTQQTKNNLPDSSQTEIESSTVYPIKDNNDKLITTEDTPCIEDPDICLATGKECDANQEKNPAEVKIPNADKIITSEDTTSKEIEGNSKTVHENISNIPEKDEDVETGNEDSDTKETEVGGVSQPCEIDSTNEANENVSSTEIPTIGNKENDNVSMLLVTQNETDTAQNEDVGQIGSIEENKLETIENNETETLDKKDVATTIENEKKLDTCTNIESQMQKLNSYENQHQMMDIVTSSNITEETSYKEDSKTDCDTQKNINVNLESNHEEIKNPEIETIDSKVDAFDDKCNAAVEASDSSSTTLQSEAISSTESTPEIKPIQSNRRQLRQKASRSPLEIIAMRQSQEEMLYIKEQAERAQRREEKQRKILDNKMKKSTFEIQIEGDESEAAAFIPDLEKKKTLTGPAQAENDAQVSPVVSKESKKRKGKDSIQTEGETATTGHPEKKKRRSKTPQPEQDSEEVIAEKSAHIDETIEDVVQSTLEFYEEAEQTLETEKISSINNLLKQCKPCTVDLVDFVQYLKMKGKEVVDDDDDGSNEETPEAEDLEEVSDKEESKHSEEEMAITDAKSDSLATEIESTPLENTRIDIAEQSASIEIASENITQTITKTIETDVKVIKRKRKPSARKQAKSVTYSAELTAEIVSNPLFVGDTTSGTVPPLRLKIKQNITANFNKKPKPVKRLHKARKGMSPAKTEKQVLIEIQEKEEDKVNLLSLGKSGFEGSFIEFIQNKDKSNTDVSNLKSQPHSMPYEDAKFRCSYRTCKFVSARREIMEAHVYIHMKNTPFRCVHCGHVFKSREITFLHMRTVHPNIEAKMEAAERIDEKLMYREIIESKNKASPAKNKSDTEQTEEYEKLESSPEAVIIKVVVPETVGDTTGCYCCSYCDFSASHQSEILDHVHSLHNQNIQYTCSLCGKQIYGFKDGMSKHFKEDHPSQPVMYKCLPEFYDLKKHEQYSPANLDKGNIFDKLNDMLPADGENGGRGKSKKCHKTSAEADSTTQETDDTAVCKKTGPAASQTSSTSKPESGEEEMDGIEQLAKSYQAAAAAAATETETSKEPAMAG